MHKPHFFIPEENAPSNFFDWMWFPRHFRQMSCLVQTLLYFRYWHRCLWNATKRWRMHAVCLWDFTRHFKFGRLRGFTFSTWISQRTISPKFCLIFHIDFGERERERGTSVCCSSYLWIHWLILTCALNEDQTCNLGILGRHTTNWATWPLDFLFLILFIYF